MSKHLFIFLILAMLTGSCAPVAASPRIPATAAASPTITASPTLPATPTITPHPSLKTTGPYLLFTRDHRHLTLMDADGSGWKQIELPNNGYIFQLNKSVSPDGNWLAYFTGLTEEPYDIALNLLNLSDETTRSISNLLRPGFPANLDPIIETMVLGDPPVYDTDCFQDEECRRSRVKNELTNSLFYFDWSPDSQSIAFTAQIEGSSSDIYIFSLQDQAIRQLTSETQNIYWLDWAPNGNRILYEISSTPGAGYEGRTLHITDLEGKSAFVDEEILYNLRWGEDDWLTEQIYLLDHPNDTDPPVYDLMTLNVETGQFKKVWPYTVDSFIVNRETQTIVLMHRNHSHVLETVPEGVYVVQSNGKYRKISDWWLILREGQGPYQVLAQDYERQLYHVRNDGSIEKLEWSGDPVPQLSPNGELLLYREYKKLALYDNSYQPLKAWSMEADSYDLTWSPDSLGIFLFTETRVSYLGIFDEQPHTLFEDCLLDRCELPRFVWLP